MPKLVIDNREVEVAPGATILDAAAKLAIDIPTMCFLKGYKPSTSCMVCVVKIVGLNGFRPACATIAEEGMRVDTNSEQVRQARKTALELLLSDHLGDCMGPCQVACPAHMNIPLMIRQIAAGKLEDAIATIKKDIAFPAVLGRICPKPCEKVCRRAAFDQAVSICLLKRYVADFDLQSAKPYSPACEPPLAEKVAIVGAGPAGLSAAYYLLQRGYRCTLFDEHEKPGGMLRYAVPEKQLSKAVLDAEIASIARLGFEFIGKTRLGANLSMEELRKNFDAVFVATGRLKPSDPALTTLETGPNGIAIDARTYQTSTPGVFAGGNAVRNRTLAVRAVADGKEAAVSISQYLAGELVTGPVKEFNTRIGKIDNEQIEDFMNNVPRTPPAIIPQNGIGFSDEQALREAARCMHCDCRKADDCKLRQYAQQYHARPTRYKGQKRRFTQQLEHPQVIFEPGKCINCGLCIQIATDAKEALGLTFIGRGFDVRVAAPFGRSIAEGLKQTARQCANACPTGALVLRENI